MAHNSKSIVVAMEGVSWRTMVVSQQGSFVDCCVLAILGLAIHGTRFDPHPDLITSRELRAFFATVQVDSVYIAFKI